MAWNGATPNAPNWGGSDNAGGSSGDLYITPDPPTIAENPSIGLTNANEVELPRAYKDFAVDNLTATNINNNPNFDASNWWRFPANGDVRAELIPLPPIIIPPLPYRRQYDLLDFRNINAGNITAQFDGLNPLGTGLVEGFRGQYNLLDAETVNISNENETGTVSIYGASKLVGTNALYVEGGTTLSGGGIVHGISIGALEVAGVNTVRLDVFPVGMDLISATYVTIDSSVGNWATAGALSLASGGALSLAGGSYIEYNSDQHYFINTSSGNDFTDILVGNIHPSFNGSASLRINGGGSGRGVELADTKSINLFTELPITTWSSATNYTVGTKIEYLDLYYNCLIANLNLQPNIPIPAFVNTVFYNVNNIVFQAGEGAFRCIVPITPPSAWVSNQYFESGDKVEFGGLYYDCGYTNLAVQPATALPPWTSGTTYVDQQVVQYSGDTYRAAGFPDPLVPPPSINWVLLFTGTDVNNIWIPFIPTSPAPPNSNWELVGSTNAITQVWPIYNPYASTIVGDRFSSVDVGAVNSIVSVLNGKSYQDATLGFVSSNGSVSTIKQVNSTGEIQIDTAGALKINTGTKTNFSAKEIENVKTLTLTSALNPTWVDATTYALNAMVERDGFNWRSEIAGNVGNIPQALLQPWLLSSNYVVGNVRYQVGINNAYICINNVSGSTTPPSADPTNWSFFQVGSNAEDVWYQMNLVVESTIVGDRLSKIQIGEQEFVGEAGVYMFIGQDAEAVGTLDATVGSGGSLTLVGQENATLGALTGTASVVGDSVYIQTIPTTGGSILIEANEDLTMGAVGEVALASTTGNMNITTLAGNITVNSADALTLGGANNASFGSTAGDVLITSQVGTNITATTGAIAITSDAGSITLTSATETSITAVDYINIQADTNVDVIANTGTIAITSGTDTTITATAGDLSLVAGDNINITAGAGDNVIVNSILDLNNNNVIDANTITGQGALTLATTGATNLNLSPDTGGLIVANKGLNLNNNNITNANTITGQTALSLTAANGQVNLTATGAGNRINFNSDAQFNNRTLFNFTGTNVGAIFGLTTQPLNLVGNQATPAVTIRGSLTMWLNATTQAPGNSISGVTTLNGRNLFSYGNFYNTASQTLGAINTATRIQMNTSLNNNLITLDTTTNIGRITFTNAGVYHVVWNAYLFHGAGGICKTAIWIRLNGTDVAGSGKTENNDSQQNETNLTSSSMVSVTAGQYIEFFWAATTTTVPLTAIAASAPFPLTPSFSCSVNIVG